jgi:hypothetical protein
MKAPLIVLAATAAGFAAASTYLYRQVNVERVRTQAEVAKSNRLEQRVRQLESGQSNASVQDESAVLAQSTPPAMQASKVPPGSMTLLASATFYPVDADSKVKEKDSKGTIQPDRGENLTKRMLEDPEARETLRRQQLTAMRYINADLAKTIGLSKDEEQKLHALLADQNLRMMEQTFHQDPNDIEGTARKSADLMAQNEAELTQLLGASRFEQYKNYQDSMPERMQVRHLRDRLDSGVALTEDQEKRLVAIMREERETMVSEALKGATPAASTADMNRQRAALYDARTEAQESANQRVRDRAATVLNAEQLKAFTDLQNEQTDMQRVTRRLMRERPIAEAALTR